MVGNIVGNMVGDFGGTSEVLRKYFGGDLGGLIYLWQANWPINGQLTAIYFNTYFVPLPMLPFLMIIPNSTISRKSSVAVVLPILLIS